MCCHSCQTVQLFGQVKINVLLQVLSKFPVMQHFLFGSLLRIDAATAWFHWHLVHYMFKHTTNVSPSFAVCEEIVLEMTSYVSSMMLNCSHSLIHFLWKFSMYVDCHLLNHVGRFPSCDKHSSFVFSVAHCIKLKIHQGIRAIKLGSLRLDFNCRWIFV